jgi:signal transduction histidine kinase
MKTVEPIDARGVRFVQEAERKRIARELHDGVVQSLTALVADLEYFRTRRLALAEGVGQEMAEKLETWQELARSSLVSMRSTLGGLRPHVHEAFDLSTALDSLLNELRLAGYTVTEECDDISITLPYEYASNLYYVIREALTNICKHAQASHITLFFFIQEGYLHMSIGDDGIGMLMAPQLATLDGYQQGLLGMRERVKLLGGHLSLESALGKGTRIDVELPLPRS